MNFLKLGFFVGLLFVTTIAITNKSTLIPPTSLEEICDLLDTDSTTLYNTIDTSWLSDALKDADDNSDTQITRYAGLYGMMSCGDIADCDDLFSQLDVLLTLFHTSSDNIDSLYTSTDSDLDGALYYYGNEDYENCSVYYLLYMSGLDNIILSNDTCILYNDNIVSILTDIDAILATYE